MLIEELWDSIASDPRSSATFRSRTSASSSTHTFKRIEPPPRAARPWSEVRADPFLVAIDDVFEELARRPRMFPIVYQRETSNLMRAANTTIANVIDATSACDAPTGSSPKNAIR